MKNISLTALVVVCWSSFSFVSAAAAFIPAQTISYDAQCKNSFSVSSKLSSTQQQQQQYQPTSQGNFGLGIRAVTNNNRYPSHASLQRQRRSLGSVTLQSLFGFGAPEIIIVLIAAAFVLGPDKLASLGKDAGKIAGELKEVPKEFQKGYEEGESDSRGRNAKIMEKEPTKEDTKEDK
eukprot:CAMPEP_0171307910 /NCGR_PEP_ID=MMETSP0816-20121228/17969_1 /TAXON_ID=420281 /ORGANISM="Proboscia inermis, Strain CCAP1064/1" /LENGTH=177 /DNA_ID=CAMNT_0011790413 /DNA_START=95 /DNA_END=628 /DNA_ORIENTATION=-